MKSRLQSLLKQNILNRRMSNPAKMFGCKLRNVSLVSQQNMKDICLFLKPDLYSHIAYRIYAYWGHPNNITEKQLNLLKHKIINSNKVTINCILYSIDTNSLNLYIRDVEFYIDNEKYNIS